MVEFKIINYTSGHISGMYDFSPDFREESSLSFTLYAKTLFENIYGFITILLTDNLIFNAFFSKFRDRGSYLLSPLPTQ